jgi:hypothetical protein
MLTLAHGIGHAAEPHRRRLAVEPEGFVGGEPAPVENAGAERIEAESHQ